MLKYEVKMMKFKDLKDKIEIPKFQRGLVWSRPKKVEFIKTLKSGLPVGVLLLSPRNDKYLVIDGLQRFSTMLAYSNNYFDYIDKEEISDTDLQVIIYADQNALLIFKNSQHAAQVKYLDMMRKIIIDCISQGKGKNLFVRSNEITNRLVNDIAILSDKMSNEIQGAVYNIIDRIEKSAQIGDVEIPLIIFNGDENELSTIFQKLNQEGVKLSKYDVFAATWVDHFVTVNNDPKFIEFIINKYEKAQEESELDIAGYDPSSMKQKGELTVFEYAFALGKAIKENCKLLFPKSNDKTVESIGFLILAELMGLSYNEMGKLAEKCDEYKNIDFKDLKDKIVGSAFYVQNKLDDYIISPHKDGKNKQISLCCHSELQIASYIIVVFKLKYEFSTNGIVSKENKKKLKEISSNLYRHYLFDILRGYWSGSGDSKLEEIISNPDTCRYTKDVDKSEFEMVISSWLIEYNDKQKQVNVSADVKLFLNYLLRETDIPVNKISYDVEHCVPKDLINKFYVEKNIKVPISTPCNLVYIPTSDNRSKGEKTYYQRQKEEPGTYKLEDSMLDKLSYPTRSDLEFTNSVGTLTEENYKNYLEERKKYLVNKFINLLYK